MDKSKLHQILTYYIRKGVIGEGPFAYGFCGVCKKKHQKKFFVKNDTQDTFYACYVESRACTIARQTRGAEWEYLSQAKFVRYLENEKSKWEQMKDIMTLENAAVVVGAILRLS